jgi:hypothetical protein
MSLPPPVDIPQQLAVANKNWTKLRRLASYAVFDGWTLTVLGAMTLICGGYGSGVGLMISLTLLGTGLFELRSVRRLRQLDSSALPHMAYNQLVLAGVIILYAIVGLYQAHARTNSGGGGLSAEIENALADAGASANDIGDQISQGAEILYAGLIVFTLAAQGGTAVYYFSRRKHLTQYLQQTPDWIQQMQRERRQLEVR